MAELRVVRRDTLHFEDAAAWAHVRMAQLPYGIDHDQ
jgi:hypothetical protein